MKHENIPGWPGYYISKRGHLYSCKIMGCVKNKNVHKWHRVKGRINRAGRCQVSLRDGTGKHLQVGISRLVAIVWVPNPNPKEFTVVMHLDNNPLNNHYKNLQWGTQKMNIYQSVVEGRNKTCVAGFDNTNRKLNPFQITQIRQEYIKAHAKLIKELAKKYNVSTRTVRRALGYK